MNNLILSQDGSHTVHSEDFGVSYHSKYGAVQETQTVFIDAGLKYLESRGLKQISILEMGFGTGLNALMTLLQFRPTTEIDYHTIEAFPLSEVQYNQLNYPEVLNLSVEEHDLFIQMHQSETSKRIALKPGFFFTKYLQKIEEFQVSQRFDLIYYDAFAPTSQAELWTEGMMRKVAALCNPDAVLVTYCAKGSFKRALRAAGFTVEPLDGPVGKREMTRGVYHKSI